MTPVRDRLRRATRDAHAALESGLDLVARLDDRAEVVRVLARLHGLFAAGEARLASLLGEAAMEGRRREPALRRDLAALGLGTEAIARLPRPALDAATRSPAAALGALYVLEGTRLGGRVIAREAAGRDWLPPGGLAFWRDDPSAAALWEDALRRIEATADVAETERGALAMFAACAEWLPARAGASLAPVPSRR